MSIDTATSRSTEQATQEMQVASNPALVDNDSPASSSDSDKYEQISEETVDQQLEPIDLETLDEHDGDVLEYVSGEFGDPDDLNPARERPDESLEGKAKDAVAEAQEKAAEAEKTEEAAEKAKAKAQDAIENAKTAASELNEARDNAEEKYSEFIDSLSTKEKKSVLEKIRTHLIVVALLPGALKGKAKSTSSLCKNLLTTIDDLEQAVTDLLGVLITEEGCILGQSSDLADQAVQARAEAEAAEAAARAAVAEATGETQNKRNERDTVDDFK